MARGDIGSDGATSARSGFTKDDLRNYTHDMLKSLLEIAESIRDDKLAALLTDADRRCTEMVDERRK